MARLIQEKQIEDLDASKITTGIFPVARIPNLNASKITSGVLNVARIPDLDASKITTGIFPAARIPDLDASKITSGVLNVARIPDLDANKITTGTLAVARIPGLPASQITSGTLAVARIPGLPASQIVSGTFANARISQSNVTQHEGAINHDALANFVANEHINHASVSIIAGSGLGGGGAITSNVNLSVNTQNSIQVSSDFLQLVNDASSPGADRYYGTNAGGTKGYHSLPTAGLSYVYSRVGVGLSNTPNIWQTISLAGAVPAGVRLVNLTATIISTASLGTDMRIISRLNSTEGVQYINANTSDSSNPSVVAYVSWLQYLTTSRTFELFIQSTTPTLASSQLFTIGYFS